MAAPTLDKVPGAGRVPHGVLRGLGLGSLGTLLALAIAYLITAGLWPVALALLALLPGFVLVHRVPLAGVVAWLVLVPFLLDVPGLRPAYWLMHRILPVGLVGLLIVTGMLRMRTSRVARLGWPEAMLAGYLGLSALTVLYTSDNVGASLIDLYDRVAVPMCLYLMVRLLRPGKEMFQWLVPVAVWTIVSQSLVGALSWLAPGVLPAGWLSRAGSRTTGSLGSPSVYGVTMLAAGLLLLHVASNERRPGVRRLFRALFLLSLVMMVLTLTRGVWLAGLVGVLAAAAAHPRQLRRVGLIAVPLMALMIVTGIAATQVDRLETRLGSDETALSRLPVIYASLQMFEEKPLLGWGWGNFDRYDREFQRPIGGFYPDKDQASHNVYLTVLAEQGIIGLSLFLAPVAWWLVVSLASYRRLPRSGLMSRRLLILLWGILGAHVAVNNFSNMKVEFGLGLWWLTLGLVAAMTSKVSDPTTEPGVPRKRSFPPMAGVRP